MEGPTLNALMVGYSASLAEAFGFREDFCLDNLFCMLSDVELCLPVDFVGESMPFFFGED